MQPSRVWASLAVSLCLVHSIQAFSPVVVDSSELRPTNVSVAVALAATARVCNSGQDCSPAEMSLEPPAGSTTTTTTASTTSTTTTTTTTTGKPASVEATTAEPESSQPVEDGLQQVAESESPRSDKAKVLEMFHKFFTRARSHDDQAQKEIVRDGVIMRLRELGFQTSFLQKSRFEFRRHPAYSYNMISILPGRHRQTKQDRIVLVGAHWDSYTKAPVS